MKLQIDIDEKWPVFSLEKPRNENDPFVVEINDDFYKEYLWIMYKYYEYQARIQVIYEHQQRHGKFSINESGDCVPEGASIDTECHGIRSTDVAQTTV